MNKNSASESYKAAGVDITAGYRAVELMKKHVARTKQGTDVFDIGGFGGLFSLDVGSMKEPVLVSGTDGVGTKLKVAFALDRHDTVGIDCVAMCVNDIICCKAKPLFFLDYIATGRLEPEIVADIVKGVADGCVQAGCAITGGETAEMPGFYPEGEYDLAGFAVGVTDRGQIPQKERIGAGDVLIALASSGVHSNGFSLVRRVLGDSLQSMSRYSDELGKTVGEALLEPTRIYVKSALSLFSEVDVLGISHITGGGFFENIPRCLPRGIAARICIKDVQTPPIFGLIEREGNIPCRDMFNTFNMGVGMVMAVRAQDVQNALRILRECGENAYVLGETIKSDEGVILCGE